MVGAPIIATRSWFVETNLQWKPTLYRRVVPRRAKGDDLSLAIGQRIRELREAAGLTIEQLGWNSGQSKGHVSSMEKGLVRPTVHTLAVLAEALGVELVDMVCFPEEDPRQQLVDRTRSLGAGVISRLLRDTSPTLKSRG
jgi:transcriptional regulator with XRE-family HTH domain